MRYDFGKGGIVLNQLKLLERETNPENVNKKKNIYKTLLSNMGAVFSGGSSDSSAIKLAYTPVNIPDQQFNVYVSADKQPGWWKGPGDISGIPVGEQTFAGVRFFLSNFNTSPVPTVFMLRGFESQVKADKIEGIIVKSKADSLFFLHTYNVNQDKVKDFEKKVSESRQNKKESIEPPIVFNYKVRYADGSNIMVPVRWSKDIGHWIDKYPGDLPNAMVGWNAKLAQAKNGEQAVVYVMQWSNPKPSAVITAIDIIAGDPKWGSAAVFAVSTAKAQK
jgi:hypothetical protein